MDAEKIGKIKLLNTNKRVDAASRSLHLAVVSSALALTNVRLFSTLSTTSTSN
jgi:hypothetical protein